MVDIVEEVLKQAEEEKAKQYKSIEVEKDIELELDLGNLLATDRNVIDTKQLRTKTEDYLKSLARDNTQFIINKLWKLPTASQDGVTLAQLPPPTTILPRAKRIPKAKPPTKWEEFARRKGLQKKKKEKLVWDEASKEWKPTWGYRSAKNKKDWLMEVPENADPFEDQFEKKKQEKKERIAKNEFQRLRNIARAKKLKVPKLGLAPTEAPSKEQVSKAIALAKTSTASLGKFTDSLPEEKPPKKLGKKRKFESNFGDVKAEAQRNLSILKQLESKKPKLDITKAVNMHLQQEETENSKKQKKKNAKGGKKGKKGGKQQHQKGRKGKGKPQKGNKKK